MLAGMAASGVVAALFPGPLAVQTSLGGGTSLARGLCKALQTSMAFAYANAFKLLRCS